MAMAMLKRTFARTIPARQKGPESSPELRPEHYHAFLITMLFSSLNSDSVKRHLSRRHLSVLNFLFNYIFNGGCSCEKAASIPARRQSENAGPRPFGYIFRCCPPSRIFFSNFSSSAPKRHLLKRHLTLSGKYYFHGAAQAPVLMGPTSLWNGVLGLRPSESQAQRGRLCERPIHLPPTPFRDPTPFARASDSVETHPQYPKNLLRLFFGLKIISIF